MTREYQIQMAKAALRHVLYDEDKGAAAINDMCAVHKIQPATLHLAALESGVTVVDGLWRYPKEQAK
jgi:hypothetical protein